MGCKAWPCFGQTLAAQLVMCERGWLLFRGALMVNALILHLYLSRINWEPVWETHAELVTALLQATVIKQ